MRSSSRLGTARVEGGGRWGLTARRGPSEWSAEEPCRGDKSSSPSVRASGWLGRGGPREPARDKQQDWKSVCPSCRAGRDAVTGAGRAQQLQILKSFRPSRRASRAASRPSAAAGLEVRPSVRCRPAGGQPSAAEAADLGIHGSETLSRRICRAAAGLSGEAASLEVCSSWNRPLVFVWRGM